MNAQLGPDDGLNIARYTSVNMLDLIIYGDNMKLDAKAITRWRQKDDFFVWELDVKKPGVYYIVGDFACPSGDARIKVLVKGSDEQRWLAVNQTKTWGSAHAKSSFVRVRFQQAGRKEIEFHPGFPWKPVNVCGLALYHGEVEPKRTALAVKVVKSP
ncbi:hypothetical protein [Persicirhabdus sediminis]|uniref:Uncharacterized protein n=1 Tax=Persicirhabdus sediminis TaxID=454144 RepID=A0A8J7MEL9_9BACT|nr:hypothetical protein [Persicirhabdus sediminis]MBK1791098.1 hypothetical protein [Persicirhabdus sediminis]